MRRAAVVIGLVLGCFWCRGLSAYAESRPIEQLPRDLANWSTMWWAIPEQMLEVASVYGPVAAVTWGPTKGAWTMLDRTSRDVWQAAKSEKRPGHASPYRRQTPGAIFRYEF